MALDIFKRVETYKGLFAIEKISLIYNLLTSVLIVFLYDRMDHPDQMLWDRALIALVTFVLMYLYRLAPCKFSAFVRVVIQMSLLSYWYPDHWTGEDYFVKPHAGNAKTIIECNPADVDALKACKASGSDKTVEEELQEVFLQIRENIQIRRFTRMEGTLVAYTHGEGRIGVMVKMDTDLGEKAYACGKDCALQIAAMNPAYLDRTKVPADVLENEKMIMHAQMAEDPKMANKPAAVLEKIVEEKRRALNI